MLGKDEVDAQEVRSPMVVAIDLVKLMDLGDGVVKEIDIEPANLLARVVEKVVDLEVDFQITPVQT